ncbi:hypothetical protein [Allorhizocola rhizosphaerae]|uniref:hypothetical protein n=1 Tax=Allorhizocola rhizosphaerae TaxID=1872709 RepID=UPI000E3CB7FE|nr:hypothetical protein [Allorhizocola rhizosphaerae]
MAGTDGLHGETSQMRAFNATPPNVSITGQSQGQGGMVEAAAFLAAKSQAEALLQKFVSDARQGYAAYTAIADGSAHDYLSGDNTGAAAVAGAANTPGAIGKDLA